MTIAIQEWDGPGTGFSIIDTVSYLDTVEVIISFPLPVRLLSKLRKRVGKRMGVRDATRPDKANLDKKHAYGKVIAIAQPTSEELRLILEMCGSNCLVHRVDVACDFHHRTLAEAQNCGEFLRRRGCQKWRGNRRRNATENITYWSVDAGVSRNIALYVDKPSRKNGRPCTHWEMRFVTAASCRRAGLSDLRILLGEVDALKLLKHEACLRTLSRHRYEKSLEEIARCTKRRYRRSFEKKTVADVEKRVQGLISAALQNRQFDYNEEAIHLVPAQEVYDRVPLLRKTLVEAGKWEELAPVIRWLR
ncbi:hypothetical protein [Chelativorans sp. YIM 93263]|uniref:hypothetical protein n=1 Tax=Chelativorans sp. YIM 93263 TaxID=2906648 RepID=UPI0023789D60|nr:hypothetical protein [Chelativorans sp. YIM 93263]